MSYAIERTLYVPGISVIIFSINDRLTNAGTDIKGLKMHLLCTACNLENAVYWEHRFSQEPHGVTSQKTAFFTVTAMKTSNLT
jgi:hypothetical protein